MPHLTDRPIGLAGLVAAVTAPDRGGVVTFLGMVRDHHAGRSVERLEYSAYAEMAERECRTIVESAEERWPVRVALEHRIGALEVGAVAVAIAVAAAHRDQAFEVCRWVIDEVKRRVPIWKKEFYADGSVAWVDPTAPGGAVPAGCTDA